MPNKIRDQLRSSLRDNLINQDESEWFAPNGTVEKVLTPEKLETLFRKTRFSWISHWRTYAESVRNHNGKSRLNILGILLYRQRNENLDKFAGWFRGDLDQFPCDDDLPLSVEKASDVLDANYASEFVSDQAIFRPLVYKENKKMVFQEDELQYRRHPIITSTTKQLGEGASGVVTTIEIPAGHYMFENGELNTRNIKLARKKFGATIMASSAVRDYTNEEGISDKLKNYNRTSKNLIYSRGSLVVKNDNDDIVQCDLFYDVAQCNLDAALAGEEPSSTPTWKTVEDRCRLISQYADLVDGVALLKDHQVVHRDIKPGNILVFDNEGERIWKLADYNFSKDTSGYAEDESISGSRPSGPFQAPEVRNRDDSVGWWSDLWSLGCIFLLVLAFANNGPEGVATLKKRRDEKAIPSKTTGSKLYAFYNRKLSADGTTHLEVNSGVTEFCNELRDNASGGILNGTEKDLFVDSLDYLETHILVPDKTLRKQLGGTEKFNQKMKEIARRYEQLVRQVEEQ